MIVPLQQETINHTSKSHEIFYKQLHWHVIHIRDFLSTCFREYNSSRKTNVRFE